MILHKIRKNSTGLVCLFILSLYLLLMLYVNFSGIPNFYLTDMYSDMCYAAEVWTQKSIFPEGWVFGNQFYAVATPVVASVFYGLTGDHLLAMGIASTIMGIGVLLSFSWMLKPVFSSIQERLIGIVVFMTLLLISGDPIDSATGWQLLFTMCSYYACYAIAVFWAFGCYLRSEHIRSVSFRAALLVACVLSFGTGIQSLRQTAVMVCPLIAVEAMGMLCRLVRKEKPVHQSTIVAILLTVSNVAGLVYAGTRSVTQVEIFGSMGIRSLSDILANILPSFSNAFSLLGFSTWIVLMLASACILVVVYLIRNPQTGNNRKAMLCFSLLIVSIAVILAVNAFTTMYVRNIYYFMLYPLVAVLAVFLYAHAGKTARVLLIVLLAVISMQSCTQRAQRIQQQTYERVSYDAVVDYLEENQITTIYAGWNWGEKIGIASDWNISVGFWTSAADAFSPVKYLCKPDVFHADPAHCAYVFFAENDAAIAVEKAAHLGVDFTLVKQFPQSEIYVFTSTKNLMQ